MIILSHAGFIAAAEEGIAILQRMSHIYPHLVSPLVGTAINNWEKRISSRLDAMQVAADIKRAEEEALSRLASELIETHQMEDVLQLLSEEFSIEINYEQLISLIGKDRYINALRREADELSQHLITHGQIAQLWNNMGKPALGGRRWTVGSIASLTG